MYERFTIKYNGNIGIATLATPSVGIGTTAPEEKLHVVGNVKANEFIGGGVNLTGIITSLGDGGLVGLISVGIILYLLDRA